MKRNLNQSGFSAVEATILVVVLVILGATTAYVIHARKRTSTPTARTTTSVGSQSTSTVSAPAGSDNQSLDAALSAAQSSQNSASQDAAQSNNALNDQQQEITVPTN